MQQSILKERQYLTYLSGSIFSTQGLWIQRMTLGWMIWDLTHSETWLGMLAFLMFFPTVVFGPLFGVMVDRVNRRLAAIVTSIVLCLISLMLSIVVINALATEYVLLFFSLVIGIANSAYQAVRLSFVPELVSLPNMPKAVAINAIIYNTSRFVGPIIAGLLIKYQGNDITFSIVAACYVPLTLVLFLIKIKPNKEVGLKQFTFFEDIKAGITYAFESVLMTRLLAIIAISAVFGRGLLEILPAMVDVLYGLGVEELAWLNSSVGVGAIMAALLLISANKQRLMTAIFLGAIGAGFLLLLFNFSNRFELGLFIVGGLGFCSTLCGVGTQSLLQVSVSSDLRGRVMSLWGAINVGGGAVGGLLFGLLTEYIGYTYTLVGIGTLCVGMSYAFTRNKKA